MCFARQMNKISVFLAPQAIGGKWIALTFETGKKESAKKVHL